MPAPTPIQIRYGPAGLLAQAASAAGQGDAWQNQHAQDMQFINNQLSNADRIQQQVIAGQQQAPNRLQQAYAQQQPQPDMNPDQIALKNSYLQSAMGDLPDDQKANLATLARSNSVTAEQFAKAVGDAAKRNSQATTDAGEDTTKAAYVQSILPNISEADKPGLLALAQDRKTTAAQLRAAGDAIIQRNALAQRVAAQQQNQGQRTQTAQQNANLEKQIEQVTAHMNIMAKALSSNGVDVNASPAQLNPAFVKRPHNSSDLVPDAMTAGLEGLAMNPQTPGLVATGDDGKPATGKMSQLPAYKAYLQAQQIRDSLQKQKDALVAGGSGGGSADNSDPTSVHIDNGGQIVQVNSVEEATALPVGTAFVTPDGRHMVRH